MMQRKYNLLQLRAALEKSWDATTMYCTEDFDEENPALGQCLVTSLVLQDYLGGELKRGKVEGPFDTGSHFWLNINGLDIDLTWEQFDKNCRLSNIRKTSRAHVLKTKDVARRYKLLQSKVQENLK